MKLKRILCLLFALAMIMCSVTAYAEWNIGSGDGAGLGDAIEGYVWNGSRQGIRITVYDVKTEKKVFKTIDVTGKTNIPTDLYYFADSGGEPIAKTTWLSSSYIGSCYDSISATSKTRFINTVENKEKRGDYKVIYSENLKDITVFSTNNKENLEKLKDALGDEYFLKFLCTKIDGLNYTDFEQGKYKIAFEPIVYTTIAGDMWAYSATEAAILDKYLREMLISVPVDFYKYAEFGPLVRYIGNLSHSQLPLSAFLEERELGVDRFTDSSSDKISSLLPKVRYKDNSIIRCMGIGVLSNIGKSMPEEIYSENIAEYHTDTNVYTSFTFRNRTGSNMTSADKFTYTISTDSSTIKSDTVSFNCPNNEEAMAWFEWKTPKSAQELKITITVPKGNVYIVDNSGKECTTLVIKSKISALAEKTPPDPKVTDTKPSWFTTYTSGSVLNSISQYAPLNGKQELSWYEWSYSTGTPKKIEHKVKLTAEMVISPSKRCYTATYNSATKKYTMKSGYGIQVSITPHLSGDTAYCTSSQHANVLFPEFNYNTRTTAAYNRLLEKSGMSFVFKTNEYSTYNDRVHFTPIWFPDNTSYTVYGEVLDVWCPAGQLSIRLTDNMTIKGNVYDDWHVAPVNP